MIPRRITDQAAKVSFSGDFIVFELYRKFIKRKRSLRINSIIIKPGKKIERNIERNYEHIYYVVEGVGKVECPELGKTMLLEPLLLMYIPVALKHIIINTGTTNLHIIDLILVE
ncbi:MAG: hypothetical protein DRO23_07565 [Thermoprotei archaeon]|nr:MAG: hypothetical protein DRO23_07565 [Thermoprotei archaeon]